jgi:uncharacterized protein YprB with RNaseH-like and TPR domain
VTPVRSLKERLQAARSSVGASLVDVEVTQLTRRIERLRAGRSRPVQTGRVQDEAALARELGGRPIEEGVLLLERTLEPGAAHGFLPVRPPVDMGVADVDHWLFLDTETTGLAGGSGTLAFLVGVARFRGGRLHLRQYLMTRFAAEMPMLRHLCADLEGDETLVSYNGKSYDLPLLATRLRLHGLANPFTALSHLDLLHEVRRRYRRRWDNCRLVTAERNLLGFERQDDLPGSQAPGAWLAYLRTGQWGPLNRVMRHNRLDLISLAVLPRGLENEIPAALPPRSGGGTVDAARVRDRLRALRGALAAVGEPPPSG